MITVDTTADDNPALSCSLREAITTANDHTAHGTCTVGTTGTNTINFSPSLEPNPTITLSNTSGGELFITSGMSIVGPGDLTISAASATGNRPLGVVAGSQSVSISGLTFTGGDLSGGAALVGGGIDVTSGSLTLTNVTVTGNVLSASSSTANASADGGGIFINTGSTLTLDHSVVSGNQANTSDTADTKSSTARGAGVESNGTLHIHYSSIEGNTATASFSPATATSGSVEADGAGVRGQGMDADHSSFINNTATATDGTGKANVVAQGGGMLALVNPLSLEQSTLAGNQVSASGGSSNAERGGGLGLQLTGSSTAAVRSATVANNGSTSGSSSSANVFNDGNGGTKTFSNTIIANPRGATSTNCAGALTSGGYNIDDGTSCGLTGMPGDQHANPMLGSLGSDGGPTKTLPLLTGSPAVDAGNGFGETTDQRGFTRPVDFPGVPNAPGGDGSDIGAFELQPGCPGQATPTASCGQPPGISSLKPPSGSITGGTTVTITGRNFTGATVVAFGSRRAANFTVNSDTQITVVSPRASFPGRADVRVSTPAGVSRVAATDRFTYTACVVPKLTGKKLKVARRKLRRADCRLGKVKGHGKKVRKQRPKPGKVLPPGSKVDVRLG